MGSIKQRGKNSWRLKVYVGVDAETGKSVYEEPTVRGTLSDARAALRRLEAEVQEHRDRLGPGSNPATRTVADLWEVYADRVLWNKGKRRSEETRAEYERNWRLHVGPALGEVRLNNLRVEMVEQFHADLLVKPLGGRWEGTGRTLSVSSVQKCHKLLCALLTSAVRWEWIAGPHVAERCGGLTAEPDRTVRAPAVATVRLILDAAEKRSAIDGAFFRLAGVTGARRGEVVALRWLDLDLDSGSVHITRALQTVRVKRDGSRASGEVVADPKTSSSARVLALDARTCALLRSHEKAVRCTRAEAGLGWDPAALVFAKDPAGQVPFSKQVWSKRWLRLQESVGVSGVRLHDLRHFVGVTLGEREPLRVVMDQLGHSRMSTSAIYQVQRPSSRAVNSIASVLDGPEAATG